MKGVVKFIFFGNFFYGLCAVALSVEASLQQRVALNNILFYVLTFVAAVIYYNEAYITERPSKAYNERTLWYNENLSLIKKTHLLLIILFVGCVVWFIVLYLPVLMHLRFYTWLVVASFPFVGLLYYGINHKGMRRFNLRRIGWLKPFSIGFCWAGLVTVLPVIYHGIQAGTPYRPTFFGFLLFIKNFMFISLLCILFDIKDYRSDFNLRLKTFVVKVGLRSTIFLIIIPLSLIGFGTFLTYALTHHFRIPKILLNSIPFVLLLAVAYSLQQRRSIFFYLIVIDGLMLVKAMCGSVAMLFF